MSGSTACKLLDAEGQRPQVAEWERELHALVCEMCELTEIETCPPMAPFIG